jgi:hypothetical protein
MQPKHSALHEGEVGNGHSHLRKKGPDGQIRFFGRIIDSFYNGLFKRCFTARQQREIRAVGCGRH